MIRYMTEKYGIDITPVEVVKETEKSVFVQVGKRLDRHAKKTAYDQWFTTWEEAHNFLVKRTQGKIRRLKDDLEGAEENLAELLTLEKPEEN
jgi:hypothetical protein